MGCFFTAHARERAFERYGIKLSIRDLSSIMTACTQGNAVLVEATDHSAIFVTEWAGKRILPLLNFERTILITFLPSDFLDAGARLSHYRKSGGAKPRAQGRGIPGRGPYKRKRFRLGSDEMDP